MTIKSLHIYPIKGLGGIELQEAILLERGMQYDRRWMLVDANGEFMSQRNDSRLALFRCSIDDVLRIKYGGSDIAVELDQYTDHKILATVWESEVYGFEVSRKVSDWFSDLLGVSCRLVRMVDGYDRYKELIRGPKQTKLSFADGYPYLILGTASIEKLSKVAGKEIPANRFRPNIIVHTSTANEEDYWNFLQVGNFKMQVIKPCVRCLVINIDQTSAEQKAEPLKSLSSYRRDGNNVIFGVNAICLEEGVIKVGDTLHCTN